MQIQDILENHGEDGKNEELAEGDSQFTEDNKESERLLEDHIPRNECPTNLNQDYEDDLLSVSRVVVPKLLKANCRHIEIEEKVFVARDKSDCQLIQHLFIDQIVCQLVPFEASKEHQE